MSQVLVDLRPAGAEAGAHVVAVHGSTRPGFEFTDLAPQDAPPPLECRPFAPPHHDDERDGPPPPFWTRVEGRAALGHTWWERDWEPTTSECAHWMRFEETPRRDGGAIDPLALVALSDTMPGAAFERMGPRRDDEQVFVPSADLTVHLLGDATSEWLLARNRCHRSHQGYASLEAELWDPAEGLVAWATQVMFYSFPDGPPPPEQLRPPS